MSDVNDSDASHVDEETLERSRQQVQEQIEAEQRLIDGRDEPNPE